MSVRDKLRIEILEVDAAALVPHHHRGGLFVLTAGRDILDVAVAIAEDAVDELEALMARGELVRPSAAQLAEWCVDTAQRFQFVILQPYVLAQALPRKPRGNA